MPLNQCEGGGGGGGGYVGGGGGAGSGWSAAGGGGAGASFYAPAALDPNVEGNETGEPQEVTITPAGAPGATGATGATGPEGPTGHTGPTGPAAQPYTESVGTSRGPTTETSLCPAGAVVRAVSLSRAYFETAGSIQAICVDPTTETRYSPGCCDR